MYMRWMRNAFLVLFIVFFILLMGTLFTEFRLKNRIDIAGEDVFVQIFVNDKLENSAKINQTSSLDKPSESITFLDHSPLSKVEIIAKYSNPEEQRDRRSRFAINFSLLERATQYYLSGSHNNRVQIESAYNFQNEATECVHGVPLAITEGVRYSEMEALLCKMRNGDYIYSIDNIYTYKDIEDNQRMVVYNYQNSNRQPLWHDAIPYRSIDREKLEAAYKRYWTILSQLNDKMLSPELMRYYSHYLQDLKSDTNIKYAEIYPLIDPIKMFSDYELNQLPNLATYEVETKMDRKLVKLVDKEGTALSPISWRSKSNDQINFHPYFSKKSSGDFVLTFF